MENEVPVTVDQKAVTIMQTYQKQVDEQLLKTVESVDTYKKGLARAEQVQARLEGQRDLIGAFLKQYNTNT